MMEQFKVDLNWRSLEFDEIIVANEMLPNW